MTSEATSKLILLGEHAAVYGYPAIGLSLPWKLTVDSKPADRWTAVDLAPEHDRAVHNVVELLQSIRLERKLEPLPPRALEIRTQIPLSSGFGSSGALCAALARAFFPDSPLEDLDTVAWRAEKLFHGTPSGIDTALALRTGIWALRTQSVPVQASALTARPLSILVAAVVRHSDTKTLVAGLRTRWDAGDELVKRHLEKLGTLTHQAIELFRGASEEAFEPGWTDVVRSARESLRSLDLETPELSRAIDAGLERGALAGKLSGAGGGGAFYLTFSNSDRAEEAKNAVFECLPRGAWSLEPRVVSI